MIEVRLPALEGEEFLAAIDAYAERLRADGDRLSTSQRHADALAAIVVAVKADGHFPTHNGQPAAATVLIPLSEADRLVAETPRQPQPLPDPQRPAGCCDRADPAVGS